MTKTNRFNVYVHCEGSELAGQIAATSRDHATVDMISLGKAKTERGWAKWARGVMSIKSSIYRDRFSQRCAAAVLERFGGPPPAPRDYRAMAAMRKKFGPGTGRPRSNKPRCYCDANTMHTAAARAFWCCKVAGKAPADVLARARSPRFKSEK